MYMSIARRQIADIDHEAKLILMMIVLKLGRGGGSQAPIADWASLLGVSEAVLGPHLRRLAKAGLLDVVSVAGKEAGRGRGRPRVEYAWSQSHAERAAGESSDEAGGSGLDGLVRSLVQGAGTYTRKLAPRKGTDGKLLAPSRKGAGARLNLGNRLVLATLLAFADQHGVVRGKGVAELAAIACMRVPRLETNITKLIALGFIRAYVPGASGSPLVGVVSGIYFLNLGHPEYGPARTPSLAFALRVTRPMLEYQDRKHGDIQQLMFDARACASKPVAAIDRARFATYFSRVPSVTREVAHTLANILVKASRLGLERYLQAILEKHASMVLTENFEATRIARLNLEQGPLLARILADIYPVRRQQQKLDDDDTVAAVELLARYLAMRVVDMADYCQGELRLFDLYGPLSAFKARKPYSLVILPWIPPTTSAYLIVIATYQAAEVAMKESFLLQPISERLVKEGDRQRLELDFDIDLVRSAPFLERMYANGLFTKPPNTDKTVAGNRGSVEGQPKKTRKSDMTTIQGRPPRPLDSGLT